MARALALALALCACVCTLGLDNGVGLTPAMGWSTWNTFGGSVSDALLRQSADAMVASGLRDAGYKYGPASSPMSALLPGVAREGRA